MKTIILIACLASLALSQQTCAATEDLYNNQCIKKTCFEVYIPRFKTIANGTGIGRIPITFVGTVQFVPGTGNVEVTLQFTDTENDGTMQRDNTNSCLTDKLFRYGSIDYTSGTEYSTTITSAYDSANLYRAWKFVIPGANLKTALVEDSSDPKYLTYNGYFGYEFQVAGMTQVYYYFNFAVKIEKNMSNQVSSTFQSIVEKGDSTCNPSGKCITKADTNLVFCKTPSDCATPTPTLQLYLNQNFAVVQTITTPGFEKYFLKPLSVTYKGTGLNRQVNIPSPSSSTAPSYKQAEGSTTVTLPVQFVYPEVQIVLQSELRSSAGRRMLTSSRFLADQGSEVGGALATSTSSSLNCIKTSESASCPTCAEQCANGAVSPSCTCNGYMLILSLALVLLAFL